jgi:predicted lipid-binding transport protein (Tim44 family)
MSNPLIQLLLLAGIAIFLVLRLRNVLGTREGYEDPTPKGRVPESRPRQEFEVIEGGPDHDIIDHVPEDSDEAKALAEMKRAEPSFSLSDFLAGARQAYEMVVMGYERGELSEIQGFLSEEIYESFVDGIAAREDEGLTIDAEFYGVREMKVGSVTYDEATNEAEIVLKYVAELTSVVRNKDGEIIEGSETDVKRQKDNWAFSRVMGSDDVNWTLVSTDA